MRQLNIDDEELVGEPLTQPVAASVGVPAQRLYRLAVSGTVVEMITRGRALQEELSDAVRTLGASEAHRLLAEERSLAMRLYERLCAEARVL